MTDYTGISKTISGSSDKASGDVLTPESFQKAVDYLGSDEYAQKEWDGMRKEANGRMIVDKAFEKGVITEYEYIHLIMGIGINGMLLVSSKMYKKLEPIAKEIGGLV